MKHLLTIFALLLALCCCTTESERLRMRVGLDSINQRNRSDLPFSVADVQPYVDFFDDHGTSNDRLLAHYLLGRAYHEHGEAPMALQCYHDAIDCADTTAADCDYKTLCRVYAQMSDVFYSQNLYDPQLASIDYATRYGFLAKDTLAALLIYAQKLDGYKMLLMPDSALYVCELSMKLLQEAGYQQTAAGMAISSVKYLLDCGEILKAKSYLELYEHESGFFDESNNIEPGREVYYYIKGCYYLKTCQYDSSEYYFRKELAVAHDFNNQNAGAYGLAQLYQKIHKPDSALKYALYSYAMNDSVYDHQATAEVARMKSLYDYTRYERAAQTERNRAARERLKTIVVLTFALVAVFVGVFVILLQRKRHNTLYRHAVRRISEAQNTILLLRAHEAILISTIKQYSEKSDETVILQSELANLKSSIKDYQAEIDKQKAIIEDFHYKRKLTKETVDQQLNQSETYRHLRLIANQGLRLSDDDWNQLMQLVVNLLPGFYNLISSKERDLSRLEYQICILDRLGIEPRRMSYLLGISESYVSRIRSGLHTKIFGSEASGKEFSSVIRSIS